MKLRFPKDDADRFLIIAVAVVLLFILLLCAGCKTKETYLIIVQDQIHIEPKCQNEPTQVNRFKKQFNRADSTFMDNLRKASKEARESADKQIYLK